MYTLLFFSFFVYSLLFTRVTSIQKRVLYSAALHFLPALKVHHIVLFSNDKGNKVYAIDFTPINQTSFSTLSKLLLGKNVPAEIRMIHLDGSHFLDTDERLIEKWIKKNDDLRNANANANANVNVNIKIDGWKSEMNLYTHNCQHFSKWAIKMTD